MCTVVGMWLAGIPVDDRAILRLAASLREAELIDTAERLERAYDREARIVALKVTDREAILRVLEECPEEMLELRATLLQEHVWRQAEGLHPARTRSQVLEVKAWRPGSNPRTVRATGFHIVANDRDMACGTRC